MSSASLKVGALFGHAVSHAVDSCNVEFDDFRGSTVGRKAHDHLVSMFDAIDPEGRGPRVPVPKRLVGCIRFSRDRLGVFGVDSLLDVRRKLTGIPEEDAMLGAFVAFQMLRTRAYRDQMTDMCQQVHDKLAGMGFEDPKIEELGKLNENDNSRSHLEAIQKSIEEFSASIGGKDFTLMQAPKGRSF